MINGESFEANYFELDNYTIPVEKYTTRIFDLADTIQTVVGIKSSNNTEVVREFSLDQNYPNPFNPVTTISFSLPEAGNVKLEIFDALGQRLEILIGRSKT